MSWWRSLTMREARREFAAGRRDPAAGAAAMAAAITAENPHLNAFTWRPAAPTVAAAGPLGGFSAAIKANLCVQGWPSDCASAILAGYRSPYESTATTRLRRAGCALLGLTNMDEFAMGSTGEHSAYGPVCNPWDPGCAAGGSSAGSAAAVAAGLAWFALGSDTGGSVRYPAHCCGVVGLKPTYGLVPRYGLVAFASSLDTVGILARGVADAGEVLAVLAGGDGRDATAGPAGPAGTGTGAADAPIAGARVGVPRAWIRTALAADAARDFERACGLLAAAGIRIVDIGLPAAEAAVPTYLVLACAEAASNLARYDGGLYGAPAQRPAGSYAEAACAARTAGFGPEVRRRILLGTHVLSAGYRGRYLDRARRSQARLAGQMAAALADVDALALPTAPAGAHALGALRDDPVAVARTDRFTVLASLARLPALTVPTGLDDRGLPLSLQLVGPAGGEDRILALGAVLERQCGFRDLQEAPWHRPA